MRQICPKPMPWNHVFECLTSQARIRRCMPPSPPIPLILAGWAYSNDIEKLQRWEETVVWATNNGCPEMVEIRDEDFYYVDEPTFYTVGPGGGPMYKPWDFEEKVRPLPNQLAASLETLKSDWKEGAGQELARVTRPLAFTGVKARRLLVQADDRARPPWGGWSHLSAVRSKRQTFTRFRASINRAIAPHEVDHVDFIPERIAEQDVPREAPQASRP